MNLTCVYMLHNGKRVPQFLDLTLGEMEELFAGRSIVKYGRHYFW